jgi:heme/copper-type cytochrome/quinol oxidase subunit 2
VLERTELRLTMMRKSTFTAIALAAFLLAAECVMACVGCREPGSETIAKESPTVLAGWAFSWSVLFMLVFVFLIVGGLSFYIWQTCRRLEREAALRVSGG